MKKKAIKILIIISVISLIIALCFVFILSQILSSRPSNIEIKTLNYSAWISANQKINRETKILQDGSNLTRERTVIFNKSEINSLLNMSVRSHNAYYNKNSTFSIQKIYFSGEDFIADLYFDLKSNNYLGRFINCKILFVPEINDDRLIIKIVNMNAGKLTVPASFLNFLISRNSSRINQNDMIKKITTAIKSFIVEDGKVKIIYNPADIIKLLNKGNRLTTGNNY